MPGRSLAFSLVFHLLVMATPLPGLLAARSAPEPPATIVIEFALQQAPRSPVLPPIYPAPTPEPKPSPGGQENQPLPPRGAETFHPQTIVSDPPQPNHPRQTLLNQLALDRVRVRLRNVRLPNIVILPPEGQATTPRLELDHLRISPAGVNLAGPLRAPVPPRPQSPAELALRNARLENLFPRISLPTSSGSGEQAAAPAVDAPLGFAPQGRLALPGLVALSASPAAPSSVLELPTTNLRARFTAGPYAGAGSPGGSVASAAGARGGRGGGPGGFQGGGEGIVVPDILVAPADGAPRSPVVAGVAGTETVLPPPPVLPPNAPPEKSAPREKTPEERAQAILERPMDTTYVFIANLSSQSSTWLLHYAEPATRNSPEGNGKASNGDGLKQSNSIAAPRVVRKPDPCYPGEAGRERVEGKVVLYGVIDARGGVSDVVVVSGLEAEVDRRAADAFARSHFEPARKHGRPISVEVLVEIPFRLAPCR